MKKKTFIFSLLLATAVMAIAKDHTIVIRGTGVQKPGITSIIPSGNGNLTDTLTVVPSKDVETITITLKDMQGNVLYYNCVPASFEDHFTIISPELPDGFYLEVYDDKGQIYKEYND